MAAWVVIPLMWASVVWSGLSMILAFAYPVVPGHEAVQTMIRIHGWLWAPAGPGLLLLTVNAWQENPVKGGIGIIAIICWWLMQDWPYDDSNPWKRAAKRARDRVASLGHRLVVVPT